jgi:FxsC-like protein
LEVEPLFFFSYSTKDAAGDYLRRLFEDLSQSVAAHKGGSPNEVGFFAPRDIDLGSVWKSQLSRALQVCKILVPIWSENYFRSPFCCKEYFAFRSRCLENPHPGDRQHNLIRPILLVRPESLDVPASCSSLQDSTEALGAGYRAKGVRYFLQHAARYGEDFQDFLLAFTHGLQDAMKACDLPARREPFDIAKLPSAFDLPDSTEKAGETRPTNRVHFVFVAGSATAMKGIRGDRAAAYGTGSHEWKPFYPASEEEIGLVAQRVALAERLVSSPLAIRVDLVKHLESEGLLNDVVAILADPWSLEIEPLHEAMRAYDRSDLLNCTLLILWNRGDPLTASRRGHLDKVLSEVLKNKMFGTTSPERFRHRIESLADLESALQAALVAAKGRLMRSMKRVDLPVLPPGGPMRAPVISGPQAT